MSLMKLSRPNIDEAAIAAVVDVLRSGNLVYGSVGQQFEHELAAYIGAREAVVVSSGTAGLYIALRGLDIGVGDAVVVPDFTFPATANAVVVTGARPIMVDVDPNHYCMTPEAAEAAIASYDGPERIAAIMPVHEFGTPCDLPAFRDLAARKNLRVVEDAACAIGARSAEGRIGSSADVACFSFHARKTVTTGEGGAIVTDDTDLAERFRTLRNHGIASKMTRVRFSEAALNFRMTDIQAAVGLHQLPRLDGWIEARRALASRYASRLETLARDGHLALPAQIPGQSWQTFMVVLNDCHERTAVIERMWDHNVETGAGAQCLRDTKAHCDNAAGPPAPFASRLARQGLALPLCEQMTLEEVDGVCAALAEVLYAGG